MIPLCTSFDTVGPMARTVRDVALVIDTLTASTNYASLLEEDVSALRVGIARKSFFDDLDPDVASCMNQADSGDRETGGAGTRGGSAGRRFPHHLRRGNL